MSQSGLGASQSFYNHPRGLTPDLEPLHIGCRNPPRQTCEQLKPAEARQSGVFRHIPPRCLQCEKRARRDHVIRAIEKFGLGPALQRLGRQRAALGNRTCAAVTKASQNWHARRLQRVAEPGKAAVLTPVGLLV